ncbi:MAG: SoxR reducing system RseC family protein [Gammaproteobacteria bacterium]|nr:SoxR reducing system RseC family protein [Gammaproteobacteria bacterium]
MNATRLTRLGTVHCVAGRKAVVFDSATCPGCDGRCGLPLARVASLPLDMDLPLGTPVAVSTSAATLTRRASIVLGLPLLGTILTAVLASGHPWADWLVPVALLGSVVLVACVGRLVSDPSETRRD